MTPAHMPHASSLSRCGIDCVIMQRSAMNMMLPPGAGAHFCNYGVSPAAAVTRSIIIISSSSTRCSLAVAEHGKSFAMLAVVFQLHISKLFANIPGVRSEGIWFAREHCRRRFPPVNETAFFVMLKQCRNNARERSCNYYQNVNANWLDCEINQLTKRLNSCYTNNMITTYRVESRRI